MKLNVFVAGVAHETWFRDTRDERQVCVLNCLDREAFLGMKFKQTFDYGPSREEAEALDLDKLDGVTLSIAVENIKAVNGGRLKVLGKIDRSTIPAEALRNGKQTPSVAKPK